MNAQASTSPRAAPLVSDFQQHAPADDGGQNRLPLVLGVTGHIDLRESDLPKLRESVARVLQDLRRLAPHTPFVLISPLAEGADRLVAEVFWEREKKDGKLVCPLPLPKEEYERDFASDQSRQIFDEYLRKATAAFVLPECQDLSTQQLREPACRNQQYKNVGRYVAQQCHILLALWDGQEKQAEGGTSQIVKMKLRVPTPDSNPDADVVLNAPELGPVIHIVTPRKSNDVTTGEWFEDKWLFPRPVQLGGNHAYDWRRKPSPEEYEAYRAIVSRIDGFNADCQDSEGDWMEKVAAAKQELVLPECQQSLTAPARSLLHHFAVADALSVKYANNTRSTFFWLFALSAIAMVLFEFCAHLFLLPHPPELLVTLGLAPYAFCFFLLIWAGAVYLWHRAHKKRYQNRFLDYRAMAEGMRVQLFWYLAGLKDLTEESYLRNQRGELDWIRYAIRTRRWEARLAGNDPDGEKNTALIIHGWVRNQAKYFEDKAPKEAEFAKRCRNIGVNSFKLLLLLALVLTGLIVLVRPPHGEAWHLTVDVLLIAIGSVVIVGAAITAYAKELGLSEHARQYKAMLRLFAAALEALQMSELKREKREELFRELGRDALAENASWLVMHRERPLEVPLP